MSHRIFIVILLTLGTLSAYLFVTAPLPLQDTRQAIQSSIPVNAMFDILAAENDAARAIYTEQIVGPGLKVGIKFNEFWKDEDIDAGPLPALFLREVSSKLSRQGTEVGLFLGSDFPIAPVNLFSGEQMQIYSKLKATSSPQYGQDLINGTYIAMYPDFASARPCVTCHNEHPDSPKLDWILNDVMGATTWLFPRERVSVAKAVEVVGIFRKAAQSTYEEFLAKTQKFKDRKPVIGKKWPSDGFFLPDISTFMEKVSNRVSKGTLTQILRLPEMVNAKKI
jgi:adenylate cyclase